jgi:surface antigen
MRRPVASPIPFAASGLTAFGLITAVFLLPDAARAGEPRSAIAGSDCACPQAGSSTKPKLAALPPPLDVADEIAALESVQIALSKVADGSSYVWHRSHGRLSGVVHPTNSFKDAKGQVCRHITVVLNSLDTTKRTEAIACRLDNGVWQLDG